VPTGNYADSEVRGENSAASDRPGPNLNSSTALKGKRCAPVIMLEKDRLHSYLYRPRAPPMERWFSTTTGYSSDQDAQRQGGVVGKTIRSKLV
jgi:hypothetical protein